MNSLTIIVAPTTSSQPRTSPCSYAKDFATASVRTMMHVQNDLVRLLLTIQSILLKVFLPTRTVRYAQGQPKYCKEYPSAARSVFMLYFCEIENVFEAEKGVWKTIGLTLFIGFIA